MKKYIYTGIILIFFGILLFSNKIVARPYPTISNVEKNNYSEKDTIDSTIVDTIEKKDSLLLKYPMNIAPDLPRTAMLFGQKINLRRYDRRERLDRELQAKIFMHSTSLLIIKRANRYFPIIEPILKKNGIPDDFKYLACIESSLDHVAYSPARAAGIWQFISATGRKYKLEINNDVDERYNLIKATQAACDYLNYAYSIFKDWPTAAASYNVGYDCMERNLKIQNINSGLDIWLVSETQRYVFRILACKIFMENPKKYGFYLKKEQLYKPIKTKKVVVSGAVDWPEFAKKNNISFYDLKFFNNWIRCEKFKNKSHKKYDVYIPLLEDRYYYSKNTYVHNKNWVIDAK